MVEFVIERGPWASEIAPRLHEAVDRWVEIPAFSMVLASGLFLFDAQRLHGLYALKVVCGLVAVAVNLYCFLAPIRLRQRAAILGDRRRVSRYSRQIYYLTLIGLPSALIAFGIGLHFLGIY